MAPIRRSYIIMIPITSSGKKVAVSIVVLTLIALGGALFYAVSLPRSSSDSKENISVRQEPNTRDNPLLGDNLDEALQAIDTLEEFGVE